ncbi:MAG: pyridoxal phosphate-dependent aminotransferase [Cyanobacteriota bacterium]
MKISSFELEKWYVKYEFSSKYNLSASGIRPLSLNDLEINFPSTKKLSYSPVNGSIELREKISTEYNVNPDQVLLTNGAIESLYLIQTILAEKHDILSGKKILALKPLYPALYSTFKDFGCEIFDWELKFENNFKPDFENLEYLIKKHKIEILIINFPNNPTGIFLNENEFNTLIEICKKYDIFIISDEVYSDFLPKKINILDYYKKACIINSFSKFYGLPGIILGYMITNKELIAECTNLKHYTTICNNIMSEAIALEVIDKKEIIRENNNNLILKNKDYTFKILNNLKKDGFIDFIEPEIGVMVFVKLNNIDSEQFCIDFEKTESILLLPANKYDIKYKNFFRLGFGIEHETLKYCMEKFDFFIRDFFNNKF